MNKESEILKNKIRLCSLENNSFNDIKEIDRKTLNSIEQDIDKVNAYNNHFKIYIYYQLSFLEFDKFCKTLKNIPVAKIDLNNFLTDNYTMNANRIVFNLITAFKFYIDSSERHILKRFGEKSIEFSRFIDLTHKYFDTFFSYRFLDKLRNYTIHVDFPIYMIPFQAQENKKNPEKMTGNLNLKVNRQDLLKEKSYLKARVTKDITELTDDIDVEPLIYELSKLILKIEKYIYSLYQTELEESISNLNMYARKYKTKNNEVAIIYAIEKIENKISAQTLTFPFDKIDEIESFKNFKA